MRRAPSHRPSGSGLAGGAAALPRVPSSGLPRSRSTRGGGGPLDPRNYVGRRVWRMWPSESPPWVEGFITCYDEGARLGTCKLAWRGCCCAAACTATRGAGALPSPPACCRPPQAAAAARARAARPLRGLLRRTNPVRPMAPDPQTPTPTRSCTTPTRARPARSRSSTLRRRARCAKQSAPGARGALARERRAPSAAAPSRQRASARPAAWLDHPPRVLPSAGRRLCAG